VAVLSRRTFVRGALAAAGAAGVAALSGCTGFSTAGGSGLIFLSTQFNAVQEAERFRRVLGSVVRRPASYVTVDPGTFPGQVQRQVDAGSVQFSLVGGLHGELAALADRYLQDIGGLRDELGDLGWAPEYQRLATLGTGRVRYIPWAQASYVLAAHQDALAQLPPGVDPTALTYDQLLDWAIAARRANGGRAMFGLPAGPKGLLHRFLQGYLYPSFTGAQVTTFRSAEAVTAWQYLRELWANTVPTSTTYDQMQDPLGRGEVRFAWDHVARLVNAPKSEPARWRMLPAPRGPKGLGYMPVLSGLAIPKGAPDPEGAKDVIRALSRPATQIEVLRSNAFFPTVPVGLPADLPPAVSMEADAVARQRAAPGAVLSLPPERLGAKEGQVTKVYQDSFRSIVVEGADIRSTLDKQAGVLRDLLGEVRASCWTPDPDSHGAVCEVL
jgi:multiple sugar transport system substrate-binding protein